MSNVTISDSIRYVGVDDRDIDLFESQYIVPNGVSYNSYIIIDDKIAIMDTVDARKTDEWLENLDKELAGKTPSYLILSHMEPDHSGSIQAVAEKYPDMKLVGNAKLFAMLPQFFDMDVDARKVVVAEGDTLELGSHTLTFVMAPMVHWPEVMVEYESRILSMRIILPWRPARICGCWCPIPRRQALSTWGQKSLRICRLSPIRPS